MTIKDMMDQVDRLVPNQFEYADKLAWLNEVEGLIYQEVILTHNGACYFHFDGYTTDTDPDTQLIAREPYCDVYRFFIEGKINQANGEMGRYNNAATAFNSVFQSFADFWNRTHMPIGRARKVRVV